MSIKTLCVLCPGKISRAKAWNGTCLRVWFVKASAKKLESQTWFKESNDPPN
jgi:hypothetical protein